ncbi:MAG TPA: hypothetical protein VEI01_06510 [Terriglobales bacterium]|nr:hypothetical protein [Terriglobales bacterium]
MILAHALAGWAYCGLLIDVSRQFLPLPKTLIVHAIGAPLGFGAIALLYFRMFAYTNPSQTATIFLAVVVSLDLFLVAPVFEKSYAMFASPLGTWVPFALIFVTTYLTGRFTASTKARIG